MTEQELLAILAKSEDSKHQFKVSVSRAEQLATEFTAFSNTEGGLLIVGVADNGAIVGLSREDIHKLNQLTSNAATQNVRPAINPISQNIEVNGKIVVVITIEKGFSKPYMDNNGCIWIKTGADKRKATSREEIRRMFQANHVLHGDEMLVGGMSTDNIDKQLFEDFYEKNYGEALDSSNLSQIFNNLNLSKDGQLNVAGALLFGKGVQHKLPAFIVKCVRFPGRDVTDVNYLDSQDIDGTLRRVFDDALGFLLRCISRVQNDQSVNSLGELEVPKIVFEELLANALIHRDYFISAPIKIFAFVDRIEIVSPGHLPNNLSIEHIKNGNSNIRNPILASFATRLLPYRGLGSGIQRALKAYPHIELAENREENWFKATILLP